MSNPPSRHHESDSHGHYGHMHGHGAGHSHAHTNVPTDSLRALLIVIALTATVFCAELLVGLISGSLALLSDAAHMLSDSAGLFIALIAMVVGRNAHSDGATFGYKRMEVFAALVNALAVSLIAVYILVQAVRRVGHQHTVDTGMMLIVAVIGLIVNSVAAMVLVRRQHDSMNLRGAYLHVLTDLLGSIAVIVAGLVIRYTGFVAADTIASVLIAALILPRSLRLVLDACHVLLEHAPEGVTVEHVQRRLQEIAGVEHVHDIHIWSLDGTTHLCSCHLVVGGHWDAERHCVVLDKATATLADMGLGHATIQIEPAAHAEHEDVECQSA
ncbi:Cadmium, cobalt and zinc/H(+)-K(+) antiporter [Corynebacterium ciconiae DSM 44920]|uniref:cation diffusion facilitator family transporter n=1 Tax=Corynebacterium ciconiae TaxID=227319 RepID=UPI0004755808|nr:cation diffusion facilitator family transporter [Corynebacterium ciconiae]WKD61042.1 Cadmium, cobalt and zinc/H(+)-K(+) antiporter [Corynebacterium ciconiae DSM 44920]